MIRPWFAFIEMTGIHFKGAAEDGLDGIGCFVPGFALAGERDQARTKLERAARDAFERYRRRHPDVVGEPIIDTNEIREFDWLIFIVLRGNRLFPVGLDFTWYPAEDEPVDA